MIANEAQLAERASRHDQDAFTELYNAYVDKIYKYVFYKLGNAPDAEDITEQVFLKAWEAIGRYKWCGYPFSSWLYKLAHNLIVDHYRTHREPLPFEAPFLADEANDPGQELDHALDAAELRSAIALLTPEQQQVVALKFIEGYRNSEIAEMLNKREGAVRALQYRALRSLQVILEAADVQEREFSMGLLDAALG